LLLMPRAVARDAARDDLAAVGQEAQQALVVFVVEVRHLLHAQLAELLLAGPAGLVRTRHRWSPSFSWIRRFRILPHPIRVRGRAPFPRAATNVRGFRPGSRAVTPTLRDPRLSRGTAPDRRGSRSPIATVRRSAGSSGSAGALRDRRRSLCA